MNKKTLYWSYSEEPKEVIFLSNFTFVGGSAVAYYLNHRLSEDLDFFTWNSSLPAETDSEIQMHFTNELKKILWTDKRPLIPGSKKR